MLAGKQMNAASEQMEAMETASRLRAAIGKLSRRLRPTLAGTGLTPTQISVLFTIARARTIGLGDLAAREGLNPTMLSRCVAQLSEDGLVRRLADPQDRRAAIVEITPAGRRLRERIHKERTDVLTAELARLDAEQGEALIAALPALESLAAQLEERRG
jgi:DNA-binding MarR family transcriptional regulator